MKISNYYLLIYCESKYWKNTQVLLYSNKDACLKVHVGKTKCIFKYPHHNAGQTDNKELQDT